MQQEASQKVYGSQDCTDKVNANRSGEVLPDDSTGSADQSG
jgi:hypothetical protein